MANIVKVTVNREDSYDEYKFAKSLTKSELIQFLERNLTEE